MRIVCDAPVEAPLVRFDATVPAASEEEARAQLWSRPRELLGATLVAALIRSSHHDPWLLGRVARLSGRELLVKIERAQPLAGRTRFTVAVYPGGTRREGLTPLSAG